VRIVVTLPTAAADDYGLVRKMLEAGMDCARINTAHDDETAWEAMAENVRRARRDLGVSCRILVDLPGPKLRTGEAVAPGGGKVPRVHVGDRIVVASDDSPDEIMPEGIRMAVPCCPRLLTEVGEGQAVWFDDGRLGGKVACVLGEGIVVEVTHAGPKGVRLKPEKGINFPDTRFGLPALGEQDRRNVFFAARRADVVALSFVNRPSDVDELRDLLEEAGVPRLGILLKIETRSGFELLPRILLAAMKGPSFGVMIARGDLAVEAGFRRLAEVQEEILWVAEAAHAPTVWATQVLEGLAKKGVPSRAEVTDAAMSARAEAVMLNKGPYIVEAIRALDDILGRMEGHQAKKTALLRPLGITRALSDP
jgi:pyruvate kinase